MSDSDWKKEECMAQIKKVWLKFPTMTLMELLQKASGSKLFEMDDVTLTQAVIDYDLHREMRRKDI